MTRKAVLIGLFMALANSFALADQERKAILIDNSGTESEVVKLRVQQENYEYRDPSSLAVQVGNLLIDIELNSVRSVESKGGNIFEVKYLWNGKEHVATGEMRPVAFLGKSDFGDIKLESSNLKQLTLIPPPVPVAKAEKYLTRDWQRMGLTYGMTLSLKDGTQLRVDNLKRQFSFYSTEGYLIGGSTRYRSDESIAFLRGSSVATVPFKAVKLIEFGDDKTITVTLRDGKKASGTVSEKAEERIDGFGGFMVDGKFSIDAKLVKFIDFGSKPAN